VTQIRNLLDKAERSLESAERELKKGNPDFAASRAYYACFHIAEALLASEGSRFSSHKQVISQYGVRFAQTEKLDRQFHQILLGAFQTRQIADYQSEVPINPKVVQELIEGGWSFLAAASRYLEEQSGGTEGGGRGEQG
jgi:uncharacterized protein (UPF0332 family)